MTTTQYLDAVKKRLGIASDYALAKHLGVTQQALSKMRRGITVMSNTTAAKVAAILDVEVLAVIADMELERGTDARLWTHIRKVHVGAGALLAVIAGAVLYRLVTDAPGAFDLTQFCDSFRANVEALAFLPFMPSIGQEYTLCLIALGAIGAVWILARGCNIRRPRAFAAGSSAAVS